MFLRRRQCISRSNSLDDVSVVAQPRNLRDSGPVHLRKLRPLQRHEIGHPSCKEVNSDRLRRGRLLSNFVLNRRRSVSVSAILQVKAKDYQ